MSAAAECWPAGTVRSKVWPLPPRIELLVAHRVGGTLPVNVLDVPNRLAKNKVSVYEGSTYAASHGSS